MKAKVGWMRARLAVAFVASGLTALNVRAQCGYEWRDIGFVDGDIRAMLQWDPDGTGPHQPLLVVGGVFNTVAGVPANKVACFDGTSWKPMPGLLPSGFVNAMTVWNGDLVIGGSFAISGSGASVFIARWTGTEWAPLPPLRNTPIALAAWNGDLYAGGFELLKLKDGIWQVLDPAFRGRVSALLTTPAGLAIGGSAMHLSTPGSGFLAGIWNGSSIQPLSNPNNSVGETLALLWHGDRLYSTGYVQMAGPPGAVVGVFKWEDNQWILVGDQLPSHVYSIAARDDELFVGGVFTGTSSNACSRFARLDGDRWKGVAGSFPGSVSSQGVYSILPTENGLYVAGRRLTNSVVSMNAIAFLAISPSPDFNTDSFVNDLDFSLFAVAYAAGACGSSSMPAGCPADFNADGFVDDADFTIFAAAYDTLLCP